MWEVFGVTDYVRQVLESIPPDTTYGTGRPFLTTYQLAIEFANRFPVVAASITASIGGEGHGPYALTTYLGRWLPHRIMNRQAAGIELRFLAHTHISEVRLDTGQEDISTTSDQSRVNFTMFRAITPGPR